MAKNIILKTKLEGAKKTKRGLKSVDSGLKSLGKSALMAGGAFFAASGIIRGFKESIRLAGIQEQAEKRLEVALGKTSRALLNQASALQKMTTFGDEAIIGVQASIAAFIDNEEQIKKATAATLDIAVAMGMDLKSAGDLIAKTLGSSTNALSRYGIEVVGAVGSTERLESLTRNIAELFGGQAAAQAETYAGSVEQLKNQLGDMGENIGKIVIPIFQKLQPHLETAIKFWSEYLDVGKETAKTQTKYARQIEDVSQSIKFQIGLIQGLADEEGKYNGVSKRHDLLRARAFDQNRSLSEQIDFEMKQIAILIKQKEELIKLEEKELLLKQTPVPPPEPPLSPETAEQQIKFGNMISQSLQTAFDPDLGAGEAMKGFVIQMMSVMQGVILASKKVSETLTFAFRGPKGVSAAIAALIGLEIAKAGVRSIKFAQAGFDGVVTKPTMFVTGEAGPERVQVTPMGQPASSSMTINISGGVVDDDYIRNTLIPALNKATGMGARINA